LNVAIFNLQDVPLTLHFASSDLGLPRGSFRIRDLWNRKDLPPSESINLTLAAHASVLYRLEPVR